MKRNLKQIFLLILFLLCLISLTACFKPSEEEVKAKMKKELYEEYGEEFEVENIGLREANGKKFYQAKIYPKSIIGTPKEDDDYYYSTASVDVARFDKPNSVGNSYGVIKMNDEAEEYLLPKAKELFGNKIRIKANVEYKIKDGDFFTQYLVSGFEEKRKEALKNPNTHRFILTLYIYIFDKIDNEKEKEERRRQLFEFLQYLKKEGLFEYTILDTIIINEDILTKSYKNYKNQLENEERTSQIIGNNEYYLLPLELRKQVISVLDKELQLMKSETIEKNINEILKSDLTDETEYTDSGIVKGNIQYFSRIYSEKNVKEEFKGAYEQGEIKLSLYDKVSDIDFKTYSKYNFLEN